MLRPALACGSGTVEAPSGHRAGQLDTPDGFDLLLPDASTPTHPVTG